MLALKQQTVAKQSVTVTYYDPATPDIPMYDIYPAIDNFGAIYAATHGRGIFRDETYLTVGVGDHPGNNNSTLQNDFQVYPNPASKEVNIVLNLEKIETVRVQVFDLQGKMVLSAASHDYAQGQQEVHLDINPLSRGTYILQVAKGDKISATKIIVTD